MRSFYGKIGPAIGLMIVAVFIWLHTSRVVVPEVAIKGDHPPIAVCLDTHENSDIRAVYRAIEDYWKPLCYEPPEVYTSPCPDVCAVVERDGQTVFYTCEAGTMSITSRSDNENRATTYVQNDGTGVMAFPRDIGEYTVAHELGHYFHFGDAELSFFGLEPPSGHLMNHRSSRQGPKMDGVPSRCKH